MKEIAEKEIWLDQMYHYLCNYSDVSMEAWNAAVSVLGCRECEKNEFLIRVGDIPDKLYYLVKGIFRIFDAKETGTEKTLVFRSDNKFLTAYSSFLEGTYSKYSFQALEHSVLLCCTMKNYRLLVESFPCWRTLNEKCVEEVFIEKEKREAELLSCDAETRYKNFLKNFPGMETRIHQYHIASYLGITPVALSRIKRKIAKLNLG